MITYNEIYEAVRKERAEGLQPLPKNFLEEVVFYLKEKRDFSASAGDDFSENTIKSKKQLENAITLFKELILRRRKKILNLLLIATETGVSKKDFENMLDFEAKMFENLMKCVDSTEKQINHLLNGKFEAKILNAPNAEVKQKILFLTDIDEFFDLDGNLIGPFKKGDEAELQKEVAQILVADGKVKFA